MFYSIKEYFLCCNNVIIYPHKASFMGHRVSGSTVEKDHAAAVAGAGTVKEYIIIISLSINYSIPVSSL